VTPLTVENRPGLSEIAYRVGKWTDFKESMTAGLSGQPALKPLTSRADDDFAIAIIDAFAVVADIVTFYQEKTANESYLGTATETRSLVELARLIGYELRPGVSASAWLAFKLDMSPGAPASAAVGAHTKVQSVPGQNETPQTFETIDALDARGVWNELVARPTETVLPREGDTFTYLAGTSTDLKPGDALLFVGAERGGDPESELWDFRRVQKVTPDSDKNRTRIDWDRGLGSLDPPGHPSSAPKVYALRVRAALFAHNAPDPRGMQITIAQQVQPGYASGDWTFTLDDTAVDLDAVYPAIGNDSWVVVSSPSGAELFKASRAVETGLTRKMVTGKGTHIDFADANTRMRFFPGSDYRRISVFAASQLLPVADRPLTTPLADSPLQLDSRLEGLPPGRPLIVRGKAMAVVALDPGTRVFTPDSGSPRPITANERFLATARVASGATTAKVKDANGIPGAVPVDATHIVWQPASDKEPTLSELVILDHADETADPQHTRLFLRAPLTNAYDPATVRISANVAAADHGESVKETLGSGDGSQPFQIFALQRNPLTYVRSSENPRGAATTLSVYVNDVRWHEVDTLYGTEPTDRVYVTRRDSEGKTTVHFGDGATGARLPSGANNVRAEYRQGLGLAGRMRPDQLSLLMTRPLGVNEVTNPLPSAGGADSETLAQVRKTAPTTVLTLDRVVSLLDYENQARSFTGVTKALATWTWNGTERVVFVTIAGPDGDPVLPGSQLRQDLSASLRRFGDPHIPLGIGSYHPAYFRITAGVAVDPDHVPSVVMSAVKAALQSRFSFDARAFGQPVELSEVVAVMQRVDGVLYVDLTRLYRADSTPARVNHLVAAFPKPQPDGTVSDAEVLILDAWERQEVRAI
jgi:hypothetical protein